MPNFAPLRAAFFSLSIKKLRRADIRPPSVRGLTRAPLGAESAPFSWFFQNNSKIVADIDTKFGVPYSTAMWHRMTKFGRNRSKFFLEIDVLVGSLNANFDQNRLNVNKFPKKRVSKQTTQKDQYTCKMTRSTKSLSRNFKLLSFLPQKFRKTNIFGKIFIKSKTFRNLKKEYMS